MPESHRTSTFIMMKKVLFMLAMLTCIFASCSDGGSEDINPTPKPDDVKYEITIDASIISNGLSFDTKAGEGSISFTANANWTLTVASTTSGATWCKASATSGAKGSATVKFTVEENTDYEDRSVSVTIKAGTASKTFTITQKGADALLVTTNKFEVAQEGGNIEVEVKANIDYQMEISETAKGWISEASSRALKSYKHTFTIAANEEVEKREGEIIFRSGDKVETVKVYQAGGAILLLTQDEYTVSDAGEMITVEIKSNIEFGVQMPDVDWIDDEASSRGMSSHTLNYYIAPNEGYDTRSAEIIFFDKNSDLQDTLKVIQAQKDAIVISQKTYEVKAEGETIEVKLSANVDFEITMPEVDWITQSESRALKEHTLYFKVAKNEGEESRSAEIVFVNKESQLSDSIVIKQQSKTTVVTLEEAGTMKSSLGEDCLTIKTLKIIGSINGDDVFYLRKMMQDGELIKLDLSESSIVEGGEWYYNKYYTSKDIIGPYMFYGCEKLQEIILPNNIHTIEYWAFYGCYSLTSITIPEAVTTIGNSAFNGCKMSSIQLPNGITQIEDGTFCGCDYLTSITIPESVTSIGSNAFLWCYRLSSIKMGSKVTVLGEGAFSECTQLSSVYINSLSDWCKIEMKSESSNPLYKSRGNLYIDNEAVTELVIPEDVTEIKDYAFYGIENIVELQIGSSVTSIGNCAFYDSSLPSCNIPDNVTTIGQGAFAGCDSLTTITFGNGIEEIPSRVLSDCPSLSEVVFGKNVKLIAYDVFGVSSKKLPVKKIVCYATTPPTCQSAKDVCDGEWRDWCSAFYISWEYYYKPSGASGFHKTATISKLEEGTKLYVPAKCGRTYETDWARCLEKVNVIEME